MSNLKGMGTSEPEGPDLAKLQAFVTQKMKEGKSRSAIIDDLAAEGMDRPEAELAAGTAYDGIAAAVAREQYDVGAVQKAVLGAIAAAIVGGIGWAAISIITGYEAGIAAWALGFLCGWAIVKVTDGSKGLPLQVVASLASLLSILVGKYVCFCYYFLGFLSEESAEVDISSLLSAEAIAAFLDNFQGMLSPLDIVFAGLAVYTAWMMLRPLGIVLPGAGLPPGMPSLG